MSKLKRPQDYVSMTPFGDWTLYELPKHPTYGSILWVCVKLMMPPGTPRKWGRQRVYTMQWNPREGRFAKNHDRFALEKDFPTLFSEVEFHLALERGTDWLNARYTPEEIAAEVSRLAHKRAIQQRSKELAADGV